MSFAKKSRFLAITCALSSLVTLQADEALYIFQQNGGQVLYNLSSATGTTINIGTSFQGTNINGAVAGTALYLVDNTYPNLYIVDLVKNQIVDTISLSGTGHDVVTQGATTLFVSNGVNTVSRIDMTNPSAAATNIKVGNNPVSLALGATSLYVANQDAQSISTINTNDNTVVNTVSVQSSPVEIALGGTGLYVIYFDETTVDVLNTSSGNVLATTIPLPNVTPQVPPTGQTSLPWAIAATGTTVAVVCPYAGAPFTPPSRGLPPYSRSGKIFFIDTTSNSIVNSSSAYTPFNVNVVGNLFYVSENDVDDVFTIIFNQPNYVASYNTSGQYQQPISAQSPVFVIQAPLYTPISSTPPAFIGRTLETALVQTPPQDIAFQMMSTTPGIPQSGIKHVITNLDSKNPLAFVLRYPNGEQYSYTIDLQTPAVLPKTMPSPAVSMSGTGPYITLIIAD